MTRLQSSRTMYDRRALPNQGMVASIATRSKAMRDQKSPICVYSICETLGVMVRFNNINMEGMYQKGSPPQIHLSAHRPLSRRGYNCAHELGHHVFGHGSSIDELRERSLFAVRVDLEKAYGNRPVIDLSTTIITRSFTSAGPSAPTHNPAFDNDVAVRSDPFESAKSHFFDTSSWGEFCDVTLTSHGEVQVKGVVLG